MNAGRKAILLLAAAFVVVGSIFIATRYRTRGFTARPSASVPAAVNTSHPQAAHQPRPQQLSSSTPPTVLQNTAIRISRADDLTSARRDVAREVKTGIDSDRITVADLQASVVDPTTPVKARIIFAEAIIGLLADQADRVDVQALSEALVPVESPLLAARMIDLLGLTENPDALDAIRSKCSMEAENVRLAGVHATERIRSTAAAQFLIACTQDPDFYRVRIQALHAVAKHPLVPTPAATIIQAVSAERERTVANTPSGQSVELNRQLIAVAATQALAASDDPQAVSFLVEELEHAENVDTVRMAAADALAQQRGEQVALALLDALHDTREGVRLHAARSLTKAFGNQYANKIADARDASTDPYVVKQITELLEANQ